MKKQLMVARGAEIPGGRNRRTYEFDGDLLVVEQVSPLKDHTEGALSNFLADAVVHADDVRRRGSHCNCAATRCSRSRDEGMEERTAVGTKKAVCGSLDEAREAESNGHQKKRKGDAQARAVAATAPDRGRVLGDVNAWLVMATGEH